MQEVFVASPTSIYHNLYYFVFWKTSLSLFQFAA